MRQKKRARPLAITIAGLIAVAMTAFTVPALPAQGQAVPRQLPPDPPPELPSVSDYSLPPGDSQTPANQAEGPVEENALPPQAAPSPDTAISGTQNDAAPAPALSIPDTVAGPANTGGNQPDLTDTARSSPPVTNAPVASSPSPATNGPPATDLTAGSPTTITTPPQPGFSTDISEVASPSDPSAVGAEPEVVIPSPSPEAGFGANIFYYIAGGMALLLLGGIGAYFWRRKTAALIHEEVANEEMDTADPASASEPISVSRKPAPKIYSPPDPAKPQKSSPLPSDGFVTSKIGVIPEPPSTADSIPSEPPKPAVPEEPALAEHFRIDFVATGASFTLLNAVLDYAITLTNVSDDGLHDIRLSGVMMQADTETAKNGASHDGEVLHKIANLPAGETIALTGDIRLPLNAIRPITFKSQALFVPLARFAVDYASDGANHHQTASFIIGREYEPRRPKMAPFRLDLGPRSLAPVGQRPLTTG